MFAKFVEVVMDPKVFIGLATLLYALAAFSYIWKENRVGMMIVYTGYVIANIGFIFDAIETASKSLSR